MPTAFKDLSDDAEDDRIAEIGAFVMRRRRTATFVTEGDTEDEKGKADRYIQKLQERFPGIQVVERGAGPAGSVWVRLGPPAN